MEIIGPYSIVVLPSPFRRSFPSISSAMPEGVAAETQKDETLGAVVQPFLADPQLRAAYAALLAAPDDSESEPKRLILLLHVPTAGAK